MRDLTGEEIMPAAKRGSNPNLLVSKYGSVYVDRENFFSEPKVIETIRKASKFKLNNYDNSSPESDNPNAKHSND